MINLRYHIVSLTAVFLAIGIGLTLGSTFLDRATVDNLNGQLENLETRLADRDEEIEQLSEELQRSEELQTSLDEQGGALLSGRIDGDPVVVVAAEGVDAGDVDGAVESLQVAGADVQGLWWLTERFLLGDDADVVDLANALDAESSDPARLRRLAVEQLGDELRTQQAKAAADADADADGHIDDEVDAGTDAGGDTIPGDESPADPSGAAGDEQPGDGATVETTPGGAGEVGPTDGADDEVDAAMPVADALFEAGFLTFGPVAEGPEQPTLPAGVRLVVVGGSSLVPDDVLVEPLVERLTRGATAPLRTVVTSAMVDSAEMSEVVAVVRDDERLRSLLSTVDALDHFQGWMATVLAVADLDERVVGHYGLGEGASALLPPPRTP